MVFYVWGNLFYGFTHVLRAREENASENYAVDTLNEEKIEKTFKKSSDDEMSYGILNLLCTPHKLCVNCCNDFSWFYSFSIKFYWNFPFSFL